MQKKKWKRVLFAGGAYGNSFLWVPNHVWLYPFIKVLVYASVILSGFVLFRSQFVNIFKHIFEEEVVVNAPISQEKRDLICKFWNLVKWLQVYLWM